MYQFSLLFMKFILFSMLGYITEMIECAIDEGRWNNRGFLCGPILPVFGVGALAMVYFLDPLKESVILVFVLGIVLTTVLEYLAAYLIEHIFHNKWWDYSKEKYNLHGRVCLKNSLLFGIAAVLVIYYIHPTIANFLIEIKKEYLMGASAVIGVIFLIDTIYSCIVAYQLRNRIIIVEDLKNQKLAKIPGMFEKMLTKKLIGKRKLPNRIVKAFPAIFHKYQKEFELMKKIEEKLNKKKDSKK